MQFNVVLARIIEIQLINNVYIYMHVCIYSTPLPIAEFDPRLLLKQSTDVAL